MGPFVNTLLYIIHKNKSSRVESWLAVAFVVVIVRFRCCKFKPSLSLSLSAASRCVCVCVFDEGRITLCDMTCDMRHDIDRRCNRSTTTTTIRLLYPFFFFNLGMAQPNLLCTALRSVMAYVASSKKKGQYSRRHAVSQVLMQRFTTDHRCFVNDQAALAATFVREEKKFEGRKKKKRKTILSCPVLLYSYW